MAAAEDAALEDAQEETELEEHLPRVIPQRVLDGDWLSRELPQLHKDFYLKHPDPALRCEEFCWGNLEAAHPVLGSRSHEEAEDYRRSKGIVVTSLRGRKAPKPFQTFQETSFPAFVEELAMELFTTDALPFPVQAQAWPCALAGADVIAVAPTGSGKTLGFLLPALVHIMAQRPMTLGEGPIALILEPTRELAAQTHKVAKQFCSRTKGEDLLRAGVIFGGVPAELQAPLQGAPDFGRWPEVLVATPGRLWELMTKRCWISAKRMSYVVLDEADHMLAAGTWLTYIKELLRLLRPDRQLLMFSATLPPDAELAALDLCGEELIKVQVDPKIPNIAQEVKLFPGSFDGGYEAKLEELLRWIREDLKPEEALLLLCQRSSLDHLAQDTELHQAIKAVYSSHSEPLGILDHQGHKEQQQKMAYREFIFGRTKALLSTFGVAGRGLDFHDSSHSPLSLAVVLFDFPPNIGEYANCIGRTCRPGQGCGRVYAFLPEGRFWIAGELIRLLEHCKQTVPESLQKMYDEDTAFMAGVKAGMQQLLAGEVDAESLPDGRFNPETKVWTLPSDIPSYRRKLIHQLADELSLPHVSHGYGEDRKLYMASDRRKLPGKFFVAGEPVVVVGRHGQKDYGTVSRDSRILKRNIKICFTNTRFFGEHPIETPVDFVFQVGQEPEDASSGRRSYSGWKNYATHYGSSYQGYR
mmetsp:Transcript_11396/g.21539  ORF Transcript_11396/g.21539 Transcript_11396/m.21539 type:complete len:697 (-) Transcript_11396:8-2098(-)